MNLEPKLDLNDSSKNDDSIKQEHVTINASNGATINSNSGNGRGEITRMFAMITTILFSIICDIGLGYVLWKGQATLSKELETTRKEAVAIHESLSRQSREGNVWLLRHDILKTIDVAEAKGTITPQEWKRLAEEYRYYLSIGGNYDVEDRFESFRAKVMGTREISMK